MRFNILSFIKTLLIASVLLATAESWAESLIVVDYGRLVSRADLDYQSPASRSEEGMPVGNGRMGSLVWTSPTQIKLQINRVDVYAQNCETNSFPARDTDYGSGCGFVDIDFVDFGEEVFTGEAFGQHLSLYDGMVTVKGKGVIARVVAWPDRDVMALEIEDSRTAPSPVGVDLRMLRYARQYHSGETYELVRNHSVKYRTRSQTATSTLGIFDSRITLTQAFREGDYYCGSAVAIAMVGRVAQTEYANDSTVRLTAAPGQGTFTILIASAASFDAEEDVEAKAIRELDAAASIGFAGLCSETASWWHQFWSQGFVYLHSPDGQADFVEQHYTYFLYLMGATSRGDYPPRFGGLLFNTDGDLRRWGSQHWWANTSAYFSGLMPSNRIDLMDPMFSMYSGMYDSCARAAAQQWGSAGIWIPETVWFDGLEDLPEVIAAEMRDLYLMRKPWDQRSEQFNEYAETKHGHNSRWNWKDSGEWVDGRWTYADKDSGAFGHTSHILGAGARIAALYWQRYEFTLDEDWLRERAYPMIKGAAEFYRHFPNVRKGDDGKYHILYVNNSESDWGSSDTEYEVSCMHMIFPLAIRASEILGVDAALRPVWQEIKDNLVELPERSRRGTRPYGAFVYSGPGAIEPLGDEQELKSRFLGFTRLGSFIDTEGIGGAQIFRNRLRLREGPGAIDAEHIGGLAAGIHETMLDSAPETPGGEPVVRIFNNWPASWDAAFKLIARGGFLVSAVQQGGRIGPVEIESQLGGTLRIRNPWPGRTVTLFRGGKQTDTLGGGLITVTTSPGESLVLTAQDVASRKLVVPE